MLSDNIKTLRKSKGLSQEELALKLNVVRQTVSKWENGLSVPDSEMLIHIASELDTSVNVLLGETMIPDDNSELKVIANKLEVINLQIAKQNESRRKMWRTMFCISAALSACILLFCFIQFIRSVPGNLNAVSPIGGADGPTDIYILSKTLKPHPLLVVTPIVTAISAIGIFKTRRK